jgi:hypothetical protein
MDLVMMVVKDGRERTLEELRVLLAAGGYALTRHIPRGQASPWPATEFTRT